MDPLQQALSAAEIGDGDTVLSLVSEHKLNEVKDFMGRTILHYMASKRQPEILAVLLATVSDPSPPDRQGWTPLHFAAQARDPHTIRLLVAKGAELDIPDAYGNTPLWRAVFEARGDIQAVRMLVELGANPDHLNKSGVSPRKLASTIANFPLANCFENPAGG